MIFSCYIHHHLLLFNDVPYRGATVLEKGIADKQVTIDDKLYEKLANCWIAAGEFDKAISPLEKAGDLSNNGDIYVRLGEVQIQRSEWQAAQQALQRGLDKGKLRDTANAQLMMGIALFNEKKYDDATKWFQQSAKADKYSKMSRGYLQLIRARQQS